MVIFIKFDDLVNSAQERGLTFQIIKQQFFFWHLVMPSIPFRSLLLVATLWP